MAPQSIQGGDDSWTIMSLQNRKQQKKEEHMINWVERCVAEHLHTVGGRDNYQEHGRSKAASQTQPVL